MLEDGEGVATDWLLPELAIWLPKLVDEASPDAVIGSPVSVTDSSVFVAWDSVELVVVPVSVI